MHRYSAYGQARKKAQLKAIVRSATSGHVPWSDPRRHRTLRACSTPKAFSLGELRRVVRDENVRKPSRNGRVTGRLRQKTEIGLSIRLPVRRQATCLSSHAIVFTVTRCGVQTAMRAGGHWQWRHADRQDRKADRRMPHWHPRHFRTELSEASGLPRFNMPLELGLFLGAKLLMVTAVQSAASGAACSTDNNIAISNSCET